MTVWWHKALAWAVFLGVLWTLRDFLPLFFLTFIFTFIMSTVVRRAAPAVGGRRPAAVLAYLALVSAIVGLAWTIGPRLVHETQAVAAEYAQRLEVQRTRERAARAEAEKTEAEAAPRRRRPNGPAGASPETAAAEAASETAPAEGVRGVVDRAAERVLGREAAETFRTTDLYAAITERAAEQAEAALLGLADRAFEIGKRLPFLLLQFALSILFSFLIVWDMPSLADSVRAIERGRLAHVYAEIAPGIVDFGRVLGKAFQAQAAIAVVNTILTGAGLLVLGIPKVVLLLSIVFFCSFIPVLGVVLSTIPIAILALKAGGLGLVLAAIAMVLVVHAIEAYVLNPNIYGQALHMHPVAVLFVLLVGEHLAGIWGLLLGVPVAYYVFEYVIQGKTGWPPRFLGD